MDNINYKNNNNPFLIHIPDNDLGSKEYMLRLQTLLNEKNVSLLPKCHFYFSQEISK